MFDSIAQKYLQNPDELPPEYIQQGFDFAKNYCEDNDLKINAFIKDKENIPLISKAIYKELPFKVKLFLKEPTIIKLLDENHDWILAKFKELNKVKKTTVKVK